jgi:uncharacterized membrane protein YkvA (DUF1232 family)
LKTAFLHRRTRTMGRKMIWFGAMRFSKASWVDRLKTWAQDIKRDVHALYLAGRDPRVPWYAKAMAALVAGYALSPLDLIPDFIPVVGYLDDLILVPLGIVLVIRLIPSEIMAEHRATAAAARDRPVSRGAAIAIVCAWVAALVLSAWLLHRYFAP